MFFAIVLIVLGFIAFLSFRDWAKYQRLTLKEKQRLLLLVSKLISLEEWQEAKKMLMPLIEKEIGGKEARLLYIQVLRGTKEHDKALQVARQASQNEPEELLYRVEEGKTHLERGDAEAALAALLVAGPILRKESELVDLATAYLRAGFANKSWEILEPLLKASPRGNTLALAGETLLEEKQYGLAIAYFTQACAIGWNTHQVQVGLGYATLYLGNFAEAERIFRKILEKDSSDVAATLGLGACMEERAHYHRALLIYQSGSAWLKKDPRLILQTGICALLAKKYNVAEECFKGMIDLGEASCELYFQHGFCLEMQQKWSFAEENYKEAVRLFPEDPRGYVALAWLFGVGLTQSLTAEEGLQVAYRALSLKPDALSYELLSAAKARVGDFDGATLLQEYLSTLDKEKGERIRRGHLLKALRKQLPLGEGHISRRLVV